MNLPGYHILLLLVYKNVKANQFLINYSRGRKIVHFWLINTPTQTEYVQWNSSAFCNTTMTNCVWIIYGIWRGTRGNVHERRESCVFLGEIINWYWYNIFDIFLNYASFFYSTRITQWTEHSTSLVKIDCNLKLHVWHTVESFANAQFTLSSWR